jgi:hypothetical protein
VRTAGYRTRLPYLRPTSDFRFKRAAPLCWGVKTSLSRLELKKPLYRRNPGRRHSRSTLESVKTSLWTFSSGGTGNETHRVESRVDALPRLEAVGFGGNATPWGISTRIALVGLTVGSRTRDCAQPLLSETFKVGRPFSATNSLKLLPTGRLASGTSVSLLKEQSINQS